VKEKLLVSAVISKRPLLEDSEVAIEGIFVMKHGIGYFVQALTDVDNTTLAIFVDSPNLEKRLFSSVPALGGGQYIYCHKAKITGVIKSSTLAGFSCAISSIRDFVFYMHGDSFAVRLDI
jgi:hypothetical protein